jgi:crotonobetainyl-CoA:carnitine CoA-transferase CaiB-like acyl-CoA transferase
VQQRRAEERHLDLIGNPLKFSKTPVSYRLAPPKFGQHTREVLEKLSEKSAD